MVIAVIITVQQPEEYIASKKNCKKNFKSWKQ